MRGPKTIPNQATRTLTEEQDARPLWTGSSPPPATRCPSCRPASARVERGGGGAPRRRPPSSPRCAAPDVGADRRGEAPLALRGDASAPTLDPAAHAAALRRRRRRRDLGAHRRPLLRRLARRPARGGGPASAVPLLRKDFIVDEVQLLEARAAGASAVLLIVRALAADRLRALARRRARGYGLDVLVEAHDDRRARVALDAGATSSASTAAISTPSRSTSTPPGAASRRIPADRIAVAESGMARGADVERRGGRRGRRRSRRHARSRRPSIPTARCAALAAVCRDARVRRPSSTRKICGLTRPEDAAAGRARSARLARRHLRRRSAAGRPWRRPGVLWRRPGQFLSLGVFGDRSRSARFCAICRRAGLSRGPAARGHTPLDGAPSSVRRGAAGLGRARGSPRPQDLDLLDGLPRARLPWWWSRGSPAPLGGTGDARLTSTGARCARSGCPRAGMVLAGGLAPENVAAAIAARPARMWWMYRSGVESAPGHQGPAANCSSFLEVTPVTLTFAALSGRSGGRFGPYGGRYVPETLIAALDELERRSTTRRAADPAFWAEFDAPAARVRRPAHAADERAAPLRDGGRAGLAQARGPQPHRRAQDQQHHRPGAAGAAHGQAPHHRRDRAPASTASPRRRSARASGSSASSTWARRTCAGRRSTSSACGCSGATVVPVDLRHAHAQGCDQRGDARLGDERQHHPLHHRLGGRARSVSAHGARLPVGHRPRGARADAASAPAGCRAPWWRASAAAPTRWASSPASSTMPTWSWSASRRRAKGSRPGSTAPRSAGAARRAARLAELPAAGRRWPGAPGAFHLGGTRLSRRRSRARWLHDTGRARYVPSPTTTRRSTAFQLFCRLEGIIPALETRARRRLDLAASGRLGSVRTRAALRERPR